MSTTTAVAASPSSPGSSVAPPFADEQQQQQRQQSLPSAAHSQPLPSSSPAASTAPPFPASSHCSHSSSSSASTPLPTESPPAAVVVRERPAVPPKPQLDVVRFSMAQARDEFDLDTILSELLELENQLSGEGGDQLLLGLPSLPVTGEKQSQNHEQKPANGYGQPGSIMAAPAEQMAKRVKFQQFVVPSPACCSPTSASTTQPDCAIPTPSSSSSIIAARLPPPQQSAFAALMGNDPCASPDADSAFGDSSSTESAHPSVSGICNGRMACNGGGGSSNGSAGGRSSEFSSADSFRGSLNTPSPTHQVNTPTSAVQPSGNHGQHRPGSTATVLPRPPSSADSYTSALSKDEQKKAKIREALEKMKEAKMKKVFVKIFLEDGSQRGLLLDERWNVAETMRQLADKINCALAPEHAIVEEYPHLRIKRVYEDHEFVVQNLEEWTSDSPNKLHFVRVPQKWALFRYPQHFLLADRNRNEFPAAENKPEWDEEQRQRLIDSYLQNDGASRVPELEGWLFLKADGKKSWRKHFFVLRASGLYYVSKPGKPRGPARDLQCLMSVFSNQVYICTEWRKKYKAPSDWGFAIKHPRIQVKTSKYIKYICAEDEPTFMRWIGALRIIKNGFSLLHNNFVLSAHSQTGQNSKATPGTPMRVDVPQVPLQRLSALDLPMSLCSSAPSPHLRHHLRTTHHNHPHHQQQQQQCSYSPDFASPATLRASLAPSSRVSDQSQLNSPVHAGFAFDQDQCNTIKRQPDQLLFNHQNHEQSATPSDICRFGDGIGTPTTSSETNAAESDSDEEQFPAPPARAEVEHHVENSRNGGIAASQRTAQPSTLSGSPWRTTNGRNSSYAAVPPPPPKRSEGTRLRTAGNIGGGGGGPAKGVQMNLMAELQMATNRQKLRLEQNL